MKKSAATSVINSNNTTSRTWANLLTDRSTVTIYWRHLFIHRNFTHQEWFKILKRNCYKKITEESSTGNTKHHHSLSQYYASWSVEYISIIDYSMPRETKLKKKKVETKEQEDIRCGSICSTLRRLPRTTKPPPEVLPITSEFSSSPLLDNLDFFSSFSTVRFFL